MSLRELILPWDRQPQEPARFQFSPAHVWALNVGGSRQILDSAGTANGTFGAGTGSTSGNAWTNTQEGWCVVFDDSGTGTTASKTLNVGNSSGSGGPSGNSFSFIGRVRFASVSAVQHIYTGWLDSASFRLSSDNKLELLKTGFVSIGKSTGTLSAGVDYDIGVSYDGTVASFFIDGVASGTASSAQTFNHASQYRFGSYPVDSDRVANGFRLYRFAVFDRPMPNEFFRQHTGSDFWALVEPRRILVPVSAGGSGSHDATGAMSAQSATVSGSAAAVATYTSIGALTAQAATVAGAANHVTTHASSGFLEAQAATVAGSATHAAVHGSIGVLEAQAATVSGSADHSAAGAFSATGALTAQAAVVAGSAAHLTLHTATGALASGSATAAGAAVHYTLHTAAGDLVADAASISGSALHEGDGAEVAKPFTGAGRPRRTRQRVVVEIDGEDFIAESVEEARALLDKAKDAAEEKASIAVKRATEAKKRPARKIVADARKSLALPTINAPGLEDYAGQIAQQIEDLYRSTIRTIEVESLLHNRDRAEEDDEDILLLIA